jgi:hypothetical protein
MHQLQPTGSIFTCVMLTTSLHTMVLADAHAKLRNVLNLTINMLHEHNLK